MRGGSGCPYNKNLGEQITGRKYNNLAGPIPRERYVSTSNLKQKKEVLQHKILLKVLVLEIYGVVHMV